MRPPDEVRHELVGQWRRKAEEDLAAAEVLLSREPPILYPACFHAQQTAEKYLKAFLTSRQVEFPKTHSIRELLSLIRPVHPALASQLEPAAVLTPYGAEVRYPGDLPEPDRQRAQQAVQLAQQVRDAVGQQLASD